MSIVFVALSILAYFGIVVIPSGHGLCACFTLYLHRHLTHGSVVFRKWLTTAMRINIWLHAGINRNHWVAVHRFHHRTSDSLEDPHSPQHVGFFCAPLPQPAVRHPRWPLKLICPQGFGLFWTNLREYAKAARNPELLAKYGNILSDTLERYVTGRNFWLGPFVMLPVLHTICSGVLFHYIGINPWWGLLAGPLATALLLAWIIYGQAYVNSYGHAAKERDARTHDFSVDIRGSWFKNFILNLVVVGEQIHHGHHGNQRSWNFGQDDLGASYIRILVRLGLARVEKA